MLISCPNCGTQFSVPDTALGASGRTLKCAKCAHKWFQSPVTEDFGLDEDSFPPPPPPKPRPAAPPAKPAARAPAPAPVEEDEGLDFDDSPSLAPSPAAESSFDLDLDEAPPPLPEMGGVSDLSFDLADESPAESIGKPAAPPRRKRGTAGLWILLLVLLLAALGGGAYYFQDKVVEMWPQADQLLLDTGLRHEKPGAGLELRNAGTPERMIFNDTDVLIVRGVIANISERTRPVPPMKLMLLDKDHKVVQDKTDQPPVTSLDPGGTASFKIQLPRPDPNAVEVNVIFVDAAEPAGK